jgi:hypothetical protein
MSEVVRTSRLRELNMQRSYGRMQTIKSKEGGSLVGVLRM